jgi:hypothetical protein
MGFVEDVFLALPLVGVEGVVLGLVLEVVVAEPVLEAGDDGVEVLDVDLVLGIDGWPVAVLFVVDEYVGNLLSHFRRDADGDECLPLGFEEVLSLPVLEEYYLWHLQLEEDLVVDGRQQLVELPHLVNVDLEHRVGLPQEGQPLLPVLVPLQTNVAAAGLADLGRAEELGHHRLQSLHPQRPIADPLLLSHHYRFISSL